MIERVAEYIVQMDEEKIAGERIWQLYVIANSKLLDRLWEEMPALFDRLPKRNSISRKFLIDPRYDQHDVHTEVKRLLKEWTTP